MLAPQNWGLHCIRSRTGSNESLLLPAGGYPVVNLVSQCTNFLAIKWAVTEKFHDYLYGSSFTVVTDSNPLTYLLTTAKLDAVSYRWLAALSTFSFTLQYRGGKQNVDADSLSRRPHGELSDDQLSTKEIERIEKFVQYHTADANTSCITDSNVVTAICEKHLVQ